MPVSWTEEGKRAAEDIRAVVLNSFPSDEETDLIGEGQQREVAYTSRKAGAK
jgi:hypothetical protein